MRCIPWPMAPCKSADQIFQRVDDDAGANGDQQNIRGDPDIFVARRRYAQRQHHRAGQIVINHSSRQRCTLAPFFRLTRWQAAVAFFGQAGWTKPHIFFLPVVSACRFLLVRLKISTNGKGAGRGRRWHVRRLRCLRAVHALRLLIALAHRMLCAILTWLALPMGFTGPFIIRLLCLSSLWEP